MDRVVVDPGVLVSPAMSGDSPPRRLWRAVVDRELELVVCPHLITELASVLGRPRFRRYLTEAEVGSYVSEVAHHSRRLPDPGSPPPRSRDPKDDYLLALAGTAGVVALVSGDRDLTDMTDNDPPVLTPAQAVDQLL